MPPHPPHRKTRLRTLTVSVLTGLAVTAVFALILKSYGIPTTVILPTSAPIWMGFSTMFFTVRRE